MGDSDDVETSEMPSERASGASTSEHPPSPAPKLNLAMSHFEVIEEEEAATATTTTTANAKK